MANVKCRVTLTEAERDELLAVVGKGRAPATQIKHANILLAVDRGEHAELMMTDAQAAAACHSTTQTVRTVKRQLVEEGLERAIRRKRRERPSRVKIDGEAEAGIVALTCTDPPEGHARWTLRLIAERSVELGYVESISHVAVGGLLEDDMSRALKPPPLMPSSWVGADDGLTAGAGGRPGCHTHGGGLRWLMLHP